MRKASKLLAVLLALVLLAIPVIPAFTVSADPIDSTYIPGGNKWTIPQYTTPVVINSNKSNVTIDKTWGAKQFTVDQKMLTQGGYGQSTGWGNLWVNNDQSTGLPYQPANTPFDVYMGWETGYFDLAIVLKNHTNYNIAEGNTDLWQYDCLQIQIGTDVNGTRYEYGIARGTGIFPNNLSYEWFPDEKEAPLTQNTEYAVNTSGSNTLYQLKVPLAKFGLTDATKWKAGYSFPFALSLHFYDPNDNTGVTPLGYFMEWASGVVGGTTEKTLSTGATMTLGGPGTTTTSGKTQTTTSGKTQTTTSGKTQTTTSGKTQTTGTTGTTKSGVTTTTTVGTTTTLPPGFINDPVKTLGVNDVTDAALTSAVQAQLTKDKITGTVGTDLTLTQSTAKLATALIGQPDYKLQYAAGTYKAIYYMNNKNQLTVIKPTTDAKAKTDTYDLSVITAANLSTKTPAIFFVATTPPTTTTVATVTDVPTTADTNATAAIATTTVAVVTTTTTNAPQQDNPSSFPWWIIVIIVVVVLVAAGVIFFLLKKKKKGDEK